MSNKKNVGLIHNLAALIYYDEQGTTKPFEELSEDQMKPYIKRVVQFLGYLDKLNLVAVSRPDPEKQRQTEQKNLDILTQIISDFVKDLTTTKPSLFPSAELAHRILR